MSVTVRKSKSEIVREIESEKVRVFQNIPGSQLLSDIQTFFIPASGGLLLKIRLLRSFLFAKKISSQAPVFLITGL